MQIQEIGELHELTGTVGHRDGQGLYLGILFQECFHHATPPHDHPLEIICVNPRVDTAY